MKWAGRSSYVFASVAALSTGPTAHGGTIGRVSALSEDLSLCPPLLGANLAIALTDLKS